MGIHPNRKAFAQACADLPQGQWRRLCIKACIAGGIAVVFISLSVERLPDLSFGYLRAHLQAATSSQWLTAILATAISFWAVGHYDGVIHRHLATGARPADARKAGATAIAVSQTLGFGVITGAILRWRMLPDQTLWQSTKITSLVAVFFLLGWAVVTSVAILILPLAPFKGVAICTLAIAAGLAVVSGLSRRTYPVAWPNLFVIGRLLALTTLDTVTAAIALWVLCPPDLALPFSVFLPAFLIAFGAGLISGAPGGAGAFEITLLALLPDVAQAPLFAAILAWRLIYFAVPAMVGAACAIIGPSQIRTALAYPVLPAVAKTARRAEAGLLAQGQLALIPAGYDQAWLAGRTAHCLVGMLDPLSGDPRSRALPHDREQAVLALMDQAGAESRMPVIYKCTARTAVSARRLGMVLRPVAREAWLDPHRFDLANPSRAALRRKLRKSATAGITVTVGHPDCPALARIAAEWAITHGGERGFSMGRFDPAYLKTQRVYVAMLGSVPVAFVSFHLGQYEWTLDLMRHRSDVPDGAMHSLIVWAIADAAAKNLPRLSLSAVSLASLAKSPAGRLAAVQHRLFGGHDQGLVQFKSAFAPNWQTLYLAAPNRLGLVLSGAEIAREVLRPRLLPPAIHQDHAEYEFATAR